MRLSLVPSTLFLGIALLGLSPVAQGQGQGQGAAKPKLYNTAKQKLLDGKQIKVGDSLEQVTAVLGAAAQSGADAVSRSPLGNRITRTYEHSGTRFVLVFEPFERDGPPRITAIFLR